ncbi:MAG: type IV pilus secretin PilQ, partial [Serratia symbiotica]|nr:type IV pilus secretin PilQ [Serratia symbiotica]
MDNVPWPRALALVLRMGNLSMTREGSVMMVSAELDAQEKQQHQQTLALQQPLHSVTLALKNADAAEIAESLN